MSVRAVEKSLEISIAEGTLQEEAINDYIDKCYPSDQGQSERLHEELVKLYNANSKDKAPPAVLVEGIARLVPVLTYPKILECWFESLVPYAVDSSGINNKLVDACREFIKEVLNNEETSESGKHYVEWLLDIFVGASLERWLPADNISAERLRFIRYNTREILLEIFPKAIEAFARLLDKRIKNAKYRLLALQLLSEAVSRCDQSKLYKIFDFDVFDTLYCCLENDQSPTIMSITATALAMIMPHVCDKLVPYLPRSFSVFGRICSWYQVENDAENARDIPIDFQSNGLEPLSTSSTTTNLSGNTDTSTAEWDVIPAKEEDQLPNFEPLFMVLYGLFPNNTLAFCRAPDQYLKKHEFVRKFDDFWNKPVIQRSSEQVFQIFLLHPGLIQFTEEQEITANSTRWQSYKSTVDIITRCVDMRVTAAAEEGGDENDNDDDEQALNALLSEHLRLFKTSMARSSASPLLGGGRSRSTSRPASCSTSRTQSPMGPRNLLPPVSPMLQHIDELPLSMMEPSAMLSPQQPPMPVVPETSKEASESDHSGRGRSKSQPPIPSLNGIMPMSPAGTVAPSPALQPAQGTTTGPTTSQGGGGLSISTHMEQAEYYFRELLLMRNELDFVNFNKYIIENKLVQLQKKLAQLDIANVRVGNLVHKNKQLSARIGLLERENEKAQKGARTLLKQRTSYESTILEKNKDLKQQITDHKEQLSLLEEEISRQQQTVERAEALAQRRGTKITELELTIAGLSEQVENFKAGQKDESNSRCSEVKISDDLNEVDFKEELQKARAAFDAQIMRNSMEANGASHDYEVRIAHLESERNRLKQILRDQELKLESGTQFVNKYDATRRKISDIQTRVQQQYETLRHAHDELLKKYSEAERELRARRLHEEERMNEFRSTLVTTQPFQSEGERVDSRPRGDRGGAQKR